MRGIAGCPTWIAMVWMVIVQHGETMNSQRRHFIKTCGAASALLLPGFAGAALLPDPAADVAAPTFSQIEKSIKAGFGGGFAVHSHHHDGGRFYADIQHAGTRYRVSSPDLYDWKVVSTVRA